MMRTATIKDRQSKRIADIGISQPRNRRDPSMEEEMMRNAVESDTLDGDQWPQQCVQGDDSCCTANVMK